MKQWLLFMSFDIHIIFYFILSCLFSFQRNALKSAKLHILTFIIFLLSSQSNSTKGEDYSNELPSSSSSSSSSLPSSPSLSSSSPSSPDLPLSSSLPQPESPLNPVTPGDLRLEVAAPHYHNDQLQVKVFWKWSYHGELIWEHITN